MKDFKNKVVVITGAGSGIGRALARNFALQGARLALSDINAANVEETARLCSGAEVVTDTLDVADREAFYRYADKVQEHFGVVHIVINNAGVGGSETAEDLTYEDFEWLMGINFWGVVYGTKAFLPKLKRAEEAHVVNISSIFGIIAFPTQSAYNASKFAVRGFTEALRHELAGSNVLPICVHPGGIKTNIARNARFYKDPEGVTDQEQTAADFEQIAKTTPEQAAEIIIKGIRRNNPRILIGGDAKLLDRIQRWMPVRYWSLVSLLFSAMRPKHDTASQTQQKQS